MAQIKGLVINLPEAGSRRTRIGAQLSIMGLTENYQFLTALRGSEHPKDRRGLSCGEDGLWRSVLQALATDLGTADYLHILEDDSDLNQTFLQWCQKLPAESNAEQIIFTDMYAGASVFPDLLIWCQKARANKQIAWLDGKQYTGCTSSWLIHRDHLLSVYTELTQQYHRSERRIPIDNTLRRLILESRLTARISLPFLTSINLEEQWSSHIQTNEPKAVLATRLLGCQLRRRLSVMSSGEDLQKLGDLLTLLMDPQDLDNFLATSLIPTLRSSKALRYKLDKRLLSEPGNPQSKSVK